MSIRSLIACALVLTTVAPLRSFPQVCRKAALASYKPMPKLEYDCDAQLQEWDEKWLKHPTRTAALQRLISQLSQFTSAAWWRTSVDDLNACDRKGEEDRPLWLFGDSEVRLVLIPDPCYQTEYNGSNAFLLVRRNGRVVVTQVLNGYFSRADDSVHLGFGKLNGQLILEITTWSGGLNPSLTNYYFAIDPKTGKAVPRKLFAGEHGPTNVISSALLLQAAPGSAEPLKIIRRHGLARSFIVYTDDANGKIDDNGRTLTRTILRWNGNFYR